MKATIEEPKERMVIIEMTESEAKEIHRLLQNVPFTMLEQWKARKASEKLHDVLVSIL